MRKSHLKHPENNGQITESGEPREKVKKLLVAKPKITYDKLAFALELKGKGYTILNLGIHFPFDEISEEDARLIVQYCKENEVNILSIDGKRLLGKATEICSAGSKSVTTSDSGSLHVEY